MRDGRWKHQIGGRLSAGFLIVLAAAVAVGVFGVVQYRGSGNSVFALLGLAAALLLLAGLNGLYKSVCVKLLVGEEEFFYQTTPWDGKAHRYEELAEAWDSVQAGVADSHPHLCWRTRGGRMEKLYYRPGEREGVEYFLARAEACRKETPEEGEV